MSAVAWFRRRLDTPEKLSDPLLKLATVYRWVALAMSLWWVLEYIPERHHIWVLTLIGLMVFLAAGAMRNREAKVASAVFNGSAMTLFGLRSYDPSFVFLPSFLALGLVLIVLGFIYNRYQEKMRQWL